MEPPHIDPAEEARHREVMHRLGVYDAAWALSKVLEHCDVMPGQNRILLPRDAVLDSPIPALFPELGEHGDNGMNAERKVPVTLLYGEGREKEVNLRYLNSNMMYRLMGSEWRLLLQESGMSRGDRLDIYTCRRRDGERCLFFFRSKPC